MSNVGTFLAILSDSVVVESEIGTVLSSFDLTAGNYIIIGTGSFSPNESGTRRLSISTTSGEIDTSIFRTATAVPSADERLNMQIIQNINISSDTTYYFNAYQSSGTALYINARVTCVRIA